MNDLPIKRNEYVIPIYIIIGFLLGFSLGYLAFGVHNSNHIEITGTVINIEGRNITITSGINSIIYTLSHNFDEEDIDIFLHRRVRLIVDMFDDRGSSSLEII